jgi:tetratricopeptide (TPR) repeat protein
LVRERSGPLNFRHALLRDTLYQLVPEAQRKQLHRAALDMYRAANTADELRLPRLALHAARTGEKETAATAYLELARRSVAAHAYVAAEAAFGRALENLSDADPERTIEAARGRGHMRFRLGRSEDALKDLRLARQHAHAAQKLELEVDLMLDEYDILDWNRDYDQSYAVMQAVEQLDASLPPALAAKLEMCRGRVHHRRGDAAASVERGLQAARMAEALGDEAFETRIAALNTTACDCANLNRLDEAERCFQEAITLAEEHGDLQHVAAARINRVLLWFARKDVPNMFEDLERTIAIARELGRQQLEYYALGSSGEIAYVMEDLERATADTLRAAEIVRQIWGQWSRELSARELLLARIALYRQDFANARSIAGRIRERMAQARANNIADAELIVTDMILLEMVELSARDASSEDWDELMTRTANIERQPLEELECVECRALAAFRAGRIEESRHQFDRALQLAVAKPNLLSDRVSRRLAEVFPAS